MIWVVISHTDRANQRHEDGKEIREVPETSEQLVDLIR